MLAAALLASVSVAQTPEDLNEGSKVEWDETNAIWRFKWWGRQGRTYFIQHTEDLQSWLYVPVIETGNDSVREWGFTSTGDKFFLRLRYTDISSADPASADFDADGVPNLFEIQNGFNPFGLVDADANGMPDEWELFNTGKFAIWPPTLSVGIPRNQTATGTIYLRNDTPSPVNYSVALADNVGPSYRFEDSLTGGAFYAWEEISATGTKLETISNADDTTQHVDFAGFTFPYFGNSFGQVHVSSNGLLTFGSPSAANGNVALPSTDAPADLIAPFWDDLDTRTIGDIYFKEETNRIIIQFENVGRFGGGTNSTYTFQVVLFSDGHIQFRYKTMAGDLNMATIGIQDSTRTLGLEVAHNVSYAANELAVEINPQSSFLSVMPAIGTVPASTTLTLDALFRSLQLPFGTYTATVTTSHDAPEVAGPYTTIATLDVFNTPSSVAVTAPGSSSQLLPGDRLDIAATATDPEKIIKVEFYLGNTKIGGDTSAPYTGSWPSASVGIHTITASATDTFDAVTTSPPVTVTVLADTDADRMPDEWEIDKFGNLEQEASADFDGDGFPNIFEFHHGTNATDPEQFPVFSPTQNTVSPILSVGAVNYFRVNASSNTAFEMATIQAALDAANEFDIIEVLPGTYNENIYIGDRVYLFSRDGARCTIIDGTEAYGSIVSLYSESIIDGFTIQNGGQTISISHGAGIHISVSANQKKARIIGCLFQNNHATTSGGAIHVTAGDLALISCTLAGNSSPQGSGIFNNPANNQIRLINTLLWNPAGDGVDIAGHVSQYTQNKVLSRDPFSGAARIDGIPLPTRDPGLAVGWSLTHDSPARDAGSAAHHYSPRDMDNELRPFGSLPDIGADEFVDTDDDFLPDWWEMDFLGGLAQNGLDDSDTPQPDGLVNDYEYLLGFNPVTPDTLGQGHGDLQEAISMLSGFLYQEVWGEDGDGDGLRDLEESLIYGSDPGSIDSNGDEVSDGAANTVGMSLTSLDTDGDGLSNEAEFALGTSSVLSDSDWDGVPDGLDWFPLDRTRWNQAAAQQGDVDPPTISIIQPEGALDVTP